MGWAICTFLTQSAYYIKVEFDPHNFNCKRTMNCATQGTWLRAVTRPKSSQSQFAEITVSHVNRIDCPRYSPPERSLLMCQWKSHRIWSQKSLTVLLEFEARKVSQDSTLLRSPMNDHQIDDKANCQCKWNGRAPRQQHNAYLSVMLRPEHKHCQPTRIVSAVNSALVCVTGGWYRCVPDLCARGMPRSMSAFVA